VTPAAEPPAWACVCLGGQFEVQGCAESQLVRGALKHCEEDAGLIRADRQVDLVAVDCEADAFGQDGKSAKPKRDVGGNVVSDVDAGMSTRHTNARLRTGKRAGTASSSC
jgi:hypothetical protein